MAHASNLGPALRPAAFFDRDGVLNVERGYAHRIEDLEWRAGAIEAVRLLNSAGYWVIVVTNQSGVARGLYDEAAVHAFHAAMSRDLAAAGAHVDAWYFCPFHEDATVERYRAPNHPWRKPNPGMLLQAMADFPIDPARSFLVGDRETDLQAAAAAGVRGFFAGEGDLSVLVSSLIEGL